MKRILFYSEQAKYYLQNASPDRVIDYFDIEVQKILRIIGYTFKMNPILIYADTQAEGKDILFQYDLDSFSLKPLSIHDCPFMGVAYDCS